MDISPQGTPSPQSARSHTPFNGLQPPSKHVRPALVPFTPADQDCFEHRIAAITASAGLPLSWVENIEWLAFCKDFIPAATLPSRKVVTSRIIPQLVAMKDDGAKLLCKEKNAMLQCDGWDTKTQKHLVAFMLTAMRQTYPLQLLDTTAEQKTADLLLEHMDQSIRVAEKDWRVKVVGLTSDALGESRKARMDLLKKYPHLVIPDCYAHQVAVS
ncbi:hypothetical protein BOTBODRAFT_102720 [Botryobasidium botryosum FD-172 SS1]|uniref:Uncharacterized protein n=1 Tax=Botryobasidium botryosum (strain FD-172 SS1) TaxID=930990 RepID=A0A067MUB6_BOTB1|nr:hypothetical protein BOTBODRAFT_102720 [Botryobasidium botryosum FD-172 SS1]